MEIEIKFYPLALKVWETYFELGILKIQSWRASRVYHSVCITILGVADFSEPANSKTFRTLQKSNKLAFEVKNSNLFKEYQYKQKYNKRIHFLLNYPTVKL